MASPDDSDLLGSDDLLGGPAPTGITGTLAIDRPFVGHGSAVDWARSITVLLAVGIIVLVAVNAVFERRRRSFAKLRLLALGALPVFLLPVANFATYEGSKRVEFCQSCHPAMDPYVRDMTNPESHTLAAVHYKNRYILEEECFQCHADYGIFGAAKAKANGLNHFLHWVRRSPTAVGVQQIRHYGPYRNELCLQCHAGSRRFLEAKAGVHRDIPTELVAKDPRTGAPVRSCLECHKPAHPTLAEWKQREGTVP